MNAVPVPTDEEYARAFDKENPGTLAFGVDSMSPAQRKEFGDLFRCGVCGMDYRFPPPDEDASKPRGRRTSA